MNPSTLSKCRSRTTISILEVEKERLFFFGWWLHTLTSHGDLYARSSIQTSCDPLSAVSFSQHTMMSSTRLASLLLKALIFCTSSSVISALTFTLESAHATCEGDPFTNVNIMGTCTQMYACKSGTCSHKEKCTLGDNPAITGRLTAVRAFNNLQVVVKPCLSVFCSAYDSKVDGRICDWIVSSTTHLDRCCFFFITVISNSLASISNMFIPNRNLPATTSNAARRETTYSTQQCNFQLKERRPSGYSIL